jgi:hypothetical protein
VMKEAGEEEEKNEAAAGDAGAAAPHGRKQRLEGIWTRSAHGPDAYSRHQPSSRQSVASALQQPREWRSATG